MTEASAHLHAQPVVAAEGMQAGIIKDSFVILSRLCDYMGPGFAHFDFNAPALV
jgi:hypothetical protein